MTFAVQKNSETVKFNRQTKFTARYASYNADLEWVFIDVSSIATQDIRAHQHSAGIKNPDISKSIGGNSSKIHLAVDSDGNPIEFIISDGTTHDVKVAPTLVTKLDLTKTEIGCADKGDDSETLKEQVKSTKSNSLVKKYRKK